MSEHVQSLEPHIMKTHKTLFLALFVSAVLAVSVEAGNRRGNSQFAPSRGRSSGHSFSSSSGFRSSGRMIGPSQRFSSMRANSFRQRSFNSGGNMASFGQRRFTSGTFNGSNGFERFGNNQNFGTIQGNRVNRFGSFGNMNRGFNNGTGNGFARLENHRGQNFGTIQGNRVNRFGSFGNMNRGFNGTGNHVFARHSADWHRDWDRHSDHWWHGHRCRFVNGSWFVFDLGFFPWYGWNYYPYDYYYPYYPYGYGAYGYGYGGYGYDPGVYDQSNYYDQGGYNSYDQSNYYDQGRYNNSYDQSSDSSVADVQDRLAREGYYHGKVDGVLGPETRHAILRYQSDKGLGMTGSLTMETRRSLGMGQGAEE
jgi:putative peptidoglycan binding protein